MINKCLESYSEQQPTFVSGLPEREQGQILLSYTLRSFTHFLWFLSVFNLLPPCYKMLNCYTQNESCVCQRFLHSGLLDLLLSLASKQHAFYHHFATRDTVKGLHSEEIFTYLRDAIAE